VLYQPQMAAGRAETQVIVKAPAKLPLAQEAVKEFLGLAPQFFTLLSANVSSAALHSHVYANER
jgi:hypothetical protein